MMHVPASTSSRTSIAFATAFRLSSASHPIPKRSAIQRFVHIPTSRTSKTTTALSTLSSLSSSSLSKSSTWMIVQNGSANNTVGRISRMSTAAAAVPIGNDDGNFPLTPNALMEAVLSNKTSSSSSSRPLVGNAVADAMYALYTADAVAFDVDSTVISEEGIDVLADYLGKGKEVAALTKRAMEGSTKFEDALQSRLDLMQPSRPAIENLLHDHPLVLTPGITTLVSSLQKANIDVWLVSGGFRIMIEPVATELGIPTTNIYANTILFDDTDAGNGAYIGFDKTEPTSRDMGKPAALQLIIDQSDGKYQNVVMVGDGATDAQARPPAKAFIGFGGIIEREAVKAQADWFVTDFDDMTRIVQLRGAAVTK